MNLALNGQLQTIASGTGQLCFYVKGQGRPLVLVHTINAAASAAEVRPLFESLSQHRTVYAIDLPGYGFAKVPGRVRRDWPAMIEGYLLEREPLVMVFVLVDGEIGPTSLDQQVLDWLRDAEVPHTVVATKSDKVKSAKRQRRRRDLAEGCMLDTGDIVWVSAAKGIGIERVRDLVLMHLAD